MSTSLDIDADDFIRIPIARPASQQAAIEADEAPRHSPLVTRLAKEFGARWVDDNSVQAWSAEGGDRVVLFAGDPVRYPEGQDVAVVLPELQRSASRRFDIAVVARDQEDKVARRYGFNRWPMLLFLRDGQYVTSISGMLDWEPFVQAVEAALQMPTSRAPTIGIPVVSANATEASCH